MTTTTSNVGDHCCMTCSRAWRITSSGWPSRTRIRALVARRSWGGVETRPVRLGSTAGSGPPGPRTAGPATTTAPSRSTPNPNGDGRRTRRVGLTERAEPLPGWRVRRRRPAGRPADVSASLGRTARGGLCWHPAKAAGRARPGSSPPRRPPPLPLLEHPIARMERGFGQRRHRCQQGIQGSVDGTLHRRHHHQSAPSAKLTMASRLWFWKPSWARTD